ncbi:alpha-L-fucosidase [Joostella atrarenae]|uniref:alpha-L-fucosidase n=1 Tax=Joostella atrarenae TaxID=679257 RepID=A0ABS9J5T1_9FLAO|nr:alpha-L-fucosidase [Joostella atrarenae]MCF8715745.1 alpha-L-fucosidase [Joostella atrarenae]
MFKSISTLLIFLSFFGGLSQSTVENETINLIKNSYYDGVSVAVPKNVSEAEASKLSSMVRPSARQLRWQNYEMLGFVHFNLNTFTGMQWGSGKEDLNIFNPKELDTDQWVSTFKSAGITSVILVCKHHDGFTLWPSKFRERTIAKTPWKDGKGDVVKEFMDACRKQGIKTSIYYSPWDKQAPYGEDSYNDLMVNELTELLTNYGNIDLVWFDGAGLDEKTSGVKMKIDWPRVYKLIRDIQPQALISGAAPDIRWVGNEAGKGRFTEWSVQGIESMEADFSGYDSGVPLTKPTLGSVEEIKNYEQLAWYPARGGLPVRVQWFWKPGQHNRGLDYMINSYFETVGQNSNLLVNLSPDNRGLIPDEDALLLKKFGEYIKEMKKHNYANGAVASATETREGGYAGNYLFDDDIRTSWVAPEGKNTGTIILKLYGSQNFNVVELQENIVDFGQRVEKFEIDAYINDKWETIGNGTTIGIRRFLKVPNTQTDSLRIRITDSRNSPSLSTVRLYVAPPLSPLVSVDRDKKGRVSIDGASTKVLYTVDGSSPQESGVLYESPFEFRNGGVVRAIAVNSEKDNFIQETRKAFSILPDEWDISKGKNMDYCLDDNPDTVAELPESKKENTFFVINFPQSTTVSGFGYVPPSKDPSVGGRIEEYVIYGLDESGEWKALANGSFGNIDNNPIERKVTFKNAVETKAIKVEINKVSKQRNTVRIADFKIY